MTGFGSPSDHTSNISDKIEGSTDHYAAQLDAPPWRAKAQPALCCHETPRVMPIIRNIMKHLITSTAFLASFSVAAAMPELPIQAGRYTFQHKMSEQPNITNAPVKVAIKGRYVVVTSESGGVFPKGVIEEGTLMWHAKSRQWIIGHNASDRYAEEVGGCSDGPLVIDLKNKIFWSC